jgi:hypothetical protein
MLPGATLLSLTSFVWLQVRLHRSHARLHLAPTCMHLQPSPAALVFSLNRAMPACSIAVGWMLHR